MDHSQNGESAVIAKMFLTVPSTSEFVVEFGAGDGYSLSNARYFIEEGWTSVLWDTEEWVTAENVNDLFAAYLVPDDVDLVSIDVDGNDYWIWKALTWRPKIVCIEYNALWDHGERKVIKYNPRNVWDHSYGYSASLDAMVDLGKEKGYFLAAELASTNLIFVDEDYWGAVPALDPETVELGWQFWVERGRACTKEFVEV